MTTASTALDIARDYLRRGWMPIPVPHRSKNPGFAGWQKLRLAETDLERHFNCRPQNIGVLLGEPSGWLIDVDLDHELAVKLAPKYLPPTPAVFGRRSNPRSHWLYRVTAPAKTQSFSSRKHGKVVEFRSTGAQTVFPGSTHQSGEPIQWEPELGDPATVDPKALLLAVERLANRVRAELGESEVPVKPPPILTPPAPPPVMKPPSVKPATTSTSTRKASAIDRCKAYLKTCPDAISGKGGHNATLRAACECYRFGLSEGGAHTVMKWFNGAKTGGERWTDEEIKHKLDSARAKVQAEGEFGCRLEENIIEHPEPLRLAEHFLDAKCRADDGTLTRRRWRKEFYIYNGMCYAPMTDEAADAEIYSHLDSLWTYKRNKQGAIEEDTDSKRRSVKIVPTSRNVREVRLALPSRGLLVDDSLDTPVWLDGHNGPDPRELVTFPNGQLHLATRTLYRNTPKLFAVNGLLYQYDPEAPPPEQWLRFLDQLWPDDPQAMQTLQEWFGYCLTPWTALQKMLLIVGPKRSGKGTIGRILSAMLGAHNVAGPTLASIGQEFGLAPLLGKLLAIISDARMSGRVDQAIVTERLLSISGEDPIDVNRKHRDQITIKLPTRIMVLTNELPRLSDASGALASRFVVLTLQESFYGREDHDLTDRLMAELPGIMLWAIDGWERLKDRGRFVQPESSAASVQALEDLGSPIGAFLRECCEVGQGKCETVDLVFRAWRAWCAEVGRKQPGTVQVFGRDLAAAVPRLKLSRPRERGEDGSEQRPRVYEGIALNAHGIILSNRAPEKEGER